MEIAGSVVAVTGAASGLGEATARTLAKAGAIILVVDVNERGAEVAAEIGGTFAQADITDPLEADRVAALAGSLGPVRGLVNAAGGGGPSHRILRRNGERFPTEQFDAVVGLNLTGTFLMIRALAPVMEAAPPLDEDGGRGAIVNVSSLAGIHGPAGVAAYAAAKAGVIGLTMTVARDLGPLGIRAVAIAPGPIDTPLFATFAKPDREAMAASCTFPKRAGRPGEFAMLVEHIFRNDFLNATCIRLDGGIAGH